MIQIHWKFEGDSGELTYQFQLMYISGGNLLALAEFQRILVIVKGRLHVHIQYLSHRGVAGSDPIGQAKHPNYK